MSPLKKISVLAAMAAGLFFIGAGRASAQLTISDVASASTVASGATITYTITVTNTGGTDATGVQIVDAIDQNVYNISCTVTSSSGSDTCSLSTVAGSTTETVALTDPLAAGANAVVTISLTAPTVTTTTTIANGASVTATSPAGTIQASAPVTVNPALPSCTANGATQLPLRLEGTAEALSSVTFNCTGLSTVEQVNLTGLLTDAVGNPLPSNALVDGSDKLIVDNKTAFRAGISSTPTDAISNASVDISSGSISITFNPAMPDSTITISGIRVNVPYTGLSSGSVAVHFTGCEPNCTSSNDTISFGPTPILPLGNVIAGLAPSTGFTPPVNGDIDSCSPAIPTPLGTPQLVSANPDPSSTAANSVKVTLTENFPRAFLTQADEDGGSGSAIQGTRFLIQLSGIPKGIVPYVPRTVSSGSSSTTGSVSPSGALTVLTRVDTLTTFSPLNADGSGGGVLTAVPNQFDQIPVGAGGTASFVYEVTADDPAATGSVTVTFFIALTGTPITGAGTITGSVGFAPLGDPSSAGTHVAAKALPQFALPTITGTASTVASCLPDLVVSMTDGPDPVASGGAIGYSVTVTNISNTAAQNVGVSLTSGAATIIPLISGLSSATVTLAATAPTATTPDFFPNTVTVTAGSPLLSPPNQVTRTTTVNPSTLPAPTAGGPSQANVLSIAVAPSSSDVVYIGTAGGGVLESSNGGLSWNQYASSMSGLSVRDLAVDPADSSTVYAGTDSGGVFKSTDGGDTWTAMNSGLTGSSSLSIRALAINPSSTTTIFAATDGGLFRSTDGAASWIMVTTYTMTAVAIDPVTPSTVYAGTLGGIAKSVDGGTTWTPLGLVHTALAIAIDPASPSTIYVGTPSGLFTSADGGASWTVLTSLPLQTITAVVLDPATPTTIYAGTLGSPGFPVYKTVDGGATWTGASSGLPDLAIQALAIDPTNTGNLYAASAAGVFTTIDAAVNWTSANAGIRNATASALVVDPANPANLYTGILNGIAKSTNGGFSWTSATFPVSSATVQAIAVDPKGGAVYAGTTAGVFKSTDGGVTWNQANGGFPNGIVPNIQRLAVDSKTTPSTIYAGTATGGTGVFISNNAGLSWTAGGSATGFTKITALAVDPGFFDTVYAGTASGGVFRSSDAGATWKAINNGLPVVNITALAIDPQNSANLYVGTGINGVYMSTDNGTDWTAVNNGLTNTDILAIALDPNNPATIYASTPAGVFKSVDGGANWATADSGLTNANVLTLVVDPIVSTTIYAGTSGAGIFKSIDGGATWHPTGASAGNSGAAPAAISEVSGDLQTGFVTQPTHPLVVVVTDANGTPVSGVSVTFAVSSGSGTLSTNLTSTDSQGVASAVLTLGSNPETDTVTAIANAAGVSGNPVTFTISGAALPDLATIMTDAPDPTGSTGTIAYSIYLVNIGGSAASDTSITDVLPPGVIFTSCTATVGTCFAANGTVIDFIGSLAAGAGAYITIAATAPAAPSVLFVRNTVIALTSSPEITAVNNQSSRTTTVLPSNAAPQAGGPPGGSVLAMVMDPASTDTLYIGTNGGGVLKSTNGGLSWNAFNTGLTGTSVPALAIDPANPTTVYAGTASAGVFKSTDGATWTPINSSPLPASIQALAANSGNNVSTIFAGTASGLYESTDDGSSWNAPATTAGSSILSLAIKPAATATIYAGTLSGTVFESSNAGLGWVAIGSVPSNSPVRALAVSSSGTLFAGTDAGLFESTNGGSSWNAASGIPAGAVEALAIDPSNALNVYAGTSSGVFKSGDGGASWAAANNGLTNLTVQALAIDPLAAANVYAGTIGGTFKSTDGATSWGAINNGVASAMVQALAIDPVTTANIYAGTSGGLFKSAAAGAGWVDGNSGLTNTDVQALAINPAAPSTMYAGTASGVFLSSNSATTWITAGLPSSSVTALAIDPASPATVYAGTASAGVFMSTDGTTWTAINAAPLPASIRALAAATASNVSTIYAGTDSGLFQSTDGGTSWSAASGIPATGILSLAVNPATPGTLFAASSSGVFQSTDAGANWTPAGDSGLTGTIQTLAVDSSNHLYAGTSSGVFKSSDSGSSWTAPGLAGMTVTVIAIDPVTPAILYAGTAGNGAFQSTDGGATWQPTGSTAGPASALSIFSGDAQSATIGVELPQALVVRVTNAVGAPLAGVPVTFAVTSGGGILASPAQVNTDAQGLAAATLVVNAGINTVTASSGSLRPVTFTEAGTYPGTGGGGGGGGLPGTQIASFPATLDFSVQANGVAPPSQTFSVSSSSGLPVDWTATVSGGDWLVVSPTTGSTGDTVSVIITKTALAAGTHLATINLTSSGATNVAAVTVSLVVSASTTLTVIPQSLEFVAAPGGTPAAQMLAISSSVAANWQAVASTSSGGNWLSLSPASGAAPANATVSVNTAGLAEGTYQGAITVTTSSSPSSSETVNVTLTLSPPVLAVTPSSLTFTASAGQNPAPQTFQVKNSGGGVLGWTASAQSDGGWLSISPSSGTAPSTVTATVNASSLATGAYAGKITVQASSGTNAANSPQVLPVVLAIDAPVIGQGGIVDGAAFSADGLSSGSIASLFGVNLASATTVATVPQGSSSLPTTLSGTQVLVNDVAVPLFYVSPTQINFQMPFDVSGPNVQVVVVSNGMRSLAATINVVPAATPEIFTEGGTSQGAVLNEDSTVNSANNAAAAGSVIQIFANGLGTTVPPAITGQLASTLSLSSTVTTPVVLINGNQAEVSFSGLAPGYVGLYQINARIPAGTPPGAAVPLQIQMGSASSNTVTIAVR